MEGKEIFTVHKARKRIKKGIVAAVALVILLVAIYVLGIYSDFLEVKEIGEQFVAVFWKRLISKAAFSLFFFVFSFLLVYFTTGRIKKNLKKADIQHPFFERKIAVVIVCALVSLLAAYFMSNSLYEKFLLFLNSTSFGVKDPVLGMDLSFYVFERPFLQLFVQNIMVAFIIVTVYSIIAYLSLFIKMGERDFSDILKEKSIMLHVIVECFLIMILVAVSVWFDAQDLLTDSFMELTGGGYVDIKIWMNFYKIAPYIILILSLVAVYFVRKKKYTKALVSCASYIGVLLLVLVVSWLTQLIYVSPNEVTAEKEYVGYNIAFTRYGYGLNNIDESEYTFAENINGADFSMDNETIRNIRIIDFPATVTATNQLQGIRSYYKIDDMNVGFYNINGQKEAVAIGPREISIENLEESSKNYINEKFRYTHGYGVVMAELNNVTDKGQPQYLIENLVQKPAEGVPVVKQPRIYFGKLTNNDVIVNTDIKELDYSEGADDKEFNYDGDAGIQLNFFKRLIFGVKTGDLKMIIANQINDDSRLLTNRNILERVKKVAPFFEYDKDPTMIIDDDGSLKWVIDGYTTTDKIPYSQLKDGKNYIRNSFKAIVDAYSGDVKFYIIDNEDPIVKTYSKIYPSLFAKEALPDSIRNKTKYPEEMFQLQCEMYTQYHVTNPVVFYNKSDVYAIAKEKYNQNEKEITPYYSLLQLDAFDKENAELVLMLPFTIAKRPNMVSWIAVGNEGENYGKIVSYKFPKNSTVYGPMQVENMIDNDPEISKELTLWDSGGSNVIRGNLLVVPLNETVLYVEPVYITSGSEQSLPLLQRIIVGHGDDIVMADTLENALAKLFGDTSQKKPEVSDNETVPENNEPSSSDKNIEEKIGAVSKAYESLEAAAAKGDWAEFGKAMEELEAAVSELEK